MLFYICAQPADASAEDKKKGKQEKVRKCIRTAAGTTWEDTSLSEWDTGMRNMPMFRHVLLWCTVDLYMFFHVFDLNECLK